MATCYTESPDMRLRKAIYAMMVIKNETYLERIDRKYKTIKWAIKNNMI